MDRPFECWALVSNRGVIRLTRNTYEEIMTIFWDWQNEKHRVVKLREVPFSHEQEAGYDDSKLAKLLWGIEI